MIQFKSYVPKKFSDGKQRFVKNDEVYTYTTDDDTEIKLMEKLGYIGINVSTKVKEVTNPIGITTEVIEPKTDVYSEVETLQQAKLILVAKYGIPKNAHADKILTKAAEVGVEFPNLKVE